MMGGSQECGVPSRREPSDRRMRAQLADLSPAYFGVVMATGIV
jgi:hypothetical protein